MKINKEKFCMIRNLFNKVDLESLIKDGAPEDEYDPEVEMILDVIDYPDPKRIETIIGEVFDYMFGQYRDKSRYIFVPKLSRDIARILSTEKFKIITKLEFSYSYYNTGDNESVIISCSDEEITYTRTFKEGRYIKNIYSIPHFASSFIKEYQLFLQNFQNEVSCGDLKQPQLKIIVHYNDNTVDKNICWYNRRQLPDEWKDFITDLGTLLFSFGFFGKLFDEDQFSKGARDGEYIFVSVEFNSSEKQYYYLTDNENVEVGDFVIVPVGEDNKEKIAEVMKVEYFREEHVPFPLEKTKKLIRICTYEDFKTFQTY